MPHLKLDVSEFARKHPAMGNVTAGYVRWRTYTHATTTAYVYAR